MARNHERSTRSHHRLQWRQPQVRSRSRRLDRKVSQSTQHTRHPVRRLLSTLQRLSQRQETNQFKGSPQHESVQHLHLRRQFYHFPSFRQFPELTYRFPNRKAAKVGAKPNGSVICLLFYTYLNMTQIYTPLNYTYR